MIDLSAEALRTAAGIAVLVALVTQLLVKPAAKSLEGKNYYNLLVNGISLVLGVVFALLAELALGSLEFASLFDAFLVGLQGTALAVFGYEGVKNITSFVRSSD